MVFDASCSCGATHSRSGAGEQVRFRVDVGNPAAPLPAAAPPNVWNATLAVPAEGLFGQVRPKRP